MSSTPPVPGTPGLPVQQWQQQSDGSWVPVVAAGLEVASIEIGKVDQGAAGVAPWLVDLRDVGGAALALGSAAGAASIPVVIASDQGRVAVKTSATSQLLVAAGATTTETVTVTTTGGRGLIVVVDPTVNTGSLQTTINGQTTNGFTYPLLVGASLTSTGAVALRVGPGITASPNVAAADLVPLTVQIVMTVAGSVTFGADYVLTP